MGFFDSIVGAVSDVVSTVGTAVSDVVQSPFGQMGLNVAGGMFGDPGLGTQAGAVYQLVSGGNAHPPPAGASYTGGVPVPGGVPVWPMPSQQHALALAPPLTPLRWKGRTFLLSPLQIRSLIEGLKRLKAARIAAIAQTTPFDPGEAPVAHGAPQEDAAAARAEYRASLGLPPPAVVVVPPSPPPPPPFRISPPPPGVSIIRNR